MGNALIPVLQARVSVSMNVSMAFTQALVPIRAAPSDLDLGYRGVHMTWRNRNVSRGRQHGLWERHKNLDREKPLDARSRYLHIDRHAKHSVRSKPVRALASCSVTAQRLCAVVGQGS